DSPPIAAVARQHVAAEGMDGRVEVRAADIAVDAFPGCDVALLCHVLVGWDRERSAKLVAHVHDWLPAGGELLVFDPFPALATVPFPSLLGLILVVNNTQGGEVHGDRLVRGWLEEAGFQVAEVRPVTAISGLIRAVKP